MPHHAYVTCAPPQADLSVDVHHSQYKIIAGEPRRSATWILPRGEMRQPWTACSIQGPWPVAVHHHPNSSRESPLVRRSDYSNSRQRLSFAASSVASMRPSPALRVALGVPNIRLAVIQSSEVQRQSFRLAAADLTGCSSRLLQDTSRTGTRCQVNTQCRRYFVGNHLQDRQFHEQRLPDII